VNLFWSFSIARSEQIANIAVVLKYLKLQMFYLWFFTVTKDIEGRIEFGTSNLVYSQIWLNLPEHDPHFFYIFL
jgi:hypothetical protein